MLAMLNVTIRSHQACIVSLLMRVLTGAGNRSNALSVETTLPTAAGRAHCYDSA